MGLRINSNIASLNAQQQLAKATMNLQGNFRRLSTGMRIASASDDAAGLAISERLRSEVRSLNQASRNANDAVSLIQTGEGAMNEISSTLIRMRELAVQSNNETVSDSDKDAMSEEFNALRSELDRIASSTEFNGTALLDGTTTSVTFQVGSGTAASDTISLTLQDVSSDALSIDALDISSVGSATTAISAIDTAINSVSSARGSFGAVQNRLTTSITNLGSAIENLTAAESRIRDVDVAAETADLTRNSILQQAAISVLAQANVQPQSALRLLG